ncbi:MAG: phospholipase C [Rubrobacteraceae bacterium]
MIPVLVLALILLSTAAATARDKDQKDHQGNKHSSRTATPIKHVVVVFQENVSFDHYFGTYPNAQNTSGEPNFHAKKGTPSVNGLTKALLEHNPNSANPQRLDRSQALTCDQDHNYLDEQKAFDNGLMDKFVEYTKGFGCTDPNTVMNYYDGNTVTALWNYAQHFSMSDNSYGTTFGPSTPGALNLVSGQTHGAQPATLAGKYGPEVMNGTVIGDPDPTYDDCSSGDTIAMTGKNIGDNLNAKGVSWGWFQGGFRPTGTTGGKAQCDSSHKNIGGASVTDYSAHHEPFQYYKSTSNPQHLAPASPAEIGHNGRANHQYDLSDFYTSLKDNNLPAVSFVKAAKYQDGHAGYSDPLDEQHFLVNVINKVQKSKDWKSTAIVVAYDDSDGWYDHQMSPILNDSQSSQDALTGAGTCGSKAPMGGYQDRCGHGPRLPLLVISPYSKVNAVDHSITDQTSVLRFIEDNWGTGRIGDSSYDELAGSMGGLFDFSHPKARKLFLNPQSGQPSHGRH